MKHVFACVTLSFMLACQTHSTVDIELEEIAGDLQNPWGIAFLSDDNILITERSGRLRLIEKGRVSKPIEGLPEIASVGQGGLLDIAVRKGWIYFSYAQPADDSSERAYSTAVAKARLSDDASKLIDVTHLFSQQPKVKSSAHFGSRLVFGAQDTLFITLGDRGTRSDDAQVLSNHIGTVVRINTDGSIPADNPFLKDATAKPEIWSYGHRNIQGATLNPYTGELWTHEHGPQGGDEINLTRAGLNYGWPVITYGEEYGGGAIGEGTSKPGMEQPLHYWVPSIAPSGMTFYTGKQYPQWQGDLFVGALKDRALVRLELDDKQVISETRMFKSVLNERVRAVTQGPDGYLYLLTDNSLDGKVLRLVPKSTASKN